MKLFCKMLFFYVFIIFAVENYSIGKAVGDEKPLYQLSLEELMDVEVFSAGKSFELMQNVPASVTVITRNEIEKFGYLTFEEILKNIPGMYLLDNTESLFIGIRGNASGGVQVLINGIPWHPSLAKGLHSTEINQFNIPVESIDRIEVIRGPMSVVYGNNAFLGTINVITNNIESAGSMVSASVGNNGVKKAFMRFSQEINGGFYVLNTGHYETDGLSGFYSEMLDDSQFANLPDEAVNKIDGQVGKKEDSVDFSCKYKKLTANFRYNKTDYGFYPTTVGLGGENNIYMTTVHGSLVYETTIANNTQFRSTGIFSRERYYIPEMSLLTPETVANQKQISRRSEIELNIIHKEDKFEFLGGYRYRLVDDLSNRFFIQLSPDSLPLADFYKDIGAVKTNELFAQLSYNFNDKLSLTSGVRYLRLPEAYSMFVTYNSLNESEYLETPIKDRNQFTGRLALVYSANDNNVIKFMVGSAAQDRDEFAFSDPEKITTYEINHVITNDIFQLSSSIFYSNTESIIQRSIVIDQASGTVIDKSDNSGKLKTLGIELSGWYKYRETFIVSGSFSLQRTEDRKFSVEAGYSPNILAKIKGEYLFGRCNIALNGYYVGSMKTGYDLIDEDNDDGTISIASRMGYDVGGYFNLGFNFRYNKMNGFYINFNGSNILDKKFHYPANEIANMKKGLIGQGRIVVLSAGYKF